MRAFVNALRACHLRALPLGVGLLLSGIRPAPAQAPHTRWLGMGHRPATTAVPRVLAGVPDNALTHGLTLSQTQVDQILAIDARYEPELLALMADHPRLATQAYRDAHNARFRAWKERRAAEIRSLLTPAQRARLANNARSLQARRPLRSTPTAGR